MQRSYGINRYDTEAPVRKVKKHYMPMAKLLWVSASPEGKAGSQVNRLLQVSVSGATLSPGLFFRRFSGKSGN